MKKYGIIVAILAFTLVASSAFAAGIGKGAKEIGAFGSISDTTMEFDGAESESLSATVQANFGYFVTDGLQVGGAVFNQQSKDEFTSGGTTSESETSTMGLDGFAKYHFYKKGQTVVPYVGAQLGYVSSTTTDDEGNESDGTAISYGAMGGAKFFVSESVSFNAELNYKLYELDFDFGGTTATADVTDLSVLLGFSVYF